MLISVENWVFKSEVRTTNSKVSGGRLTPTQSSSFRTGHYIFISFNYKINAMPIRTESPRALAVQVLFSNSITLM
jgi:hypothetical protein